MLDKLVVCCSRELGIVDDVKVDVEDNEKGTSLDSELVVPDVCFSMELECGKVEVLVCSSVKIETVNVDKLFDDVKKGVMSDTDDEGLEDCFSVELELFNDEEDEHKL